MKKLIAAIFLIASPASAENADYGSVSLGGLARETSWPFNPAGLDNTMVCNVNGPDGFLSIRSGPSANTKAVRKLNRLAIIEVDTRQRNGNWVRVVDAYRTHTKDGTRQDYKSLSVTGWAHDGYLCSFLD